MSVATKLFLLPGAPMIQLSLSRLSRPFTSDLGGSFLITEEGVSISARSESTASASGMASATLSGLRTATQSAGARPSTPAITLWNFSAVQLLAGWEGSYFVCPNEEVGR